ncbi:hypothetical protein HY480_03500 [Candidatus Uhrbacteria bacterium]|nr:hypothetical protein [Candidatus Uhrbacteria bacterium]
MSVLLFSELIECFVSVIRVYCTDWNLHTRRDYVEERTRADQTDGPDGVWVLLVNGDRTDRVEAVAHTDASDGGVVESSVTSFLLCGLNALDVLEVRALEVLRRPLIGVIDSSNLNKR